MLSAKQFYFSIASKTVAAVEKQLREKNILAKIESEAMKGKSRLSLKEKLLPDERVWLSNAGFEVDDFGWVVKWSQCFAQSLEGNYQRASNSCSSDEEKDSSSFGSKESEENSDESD